MTICIKLHKNKSRCFISFCYLLLLLCMTFIVLNHHRYVRQWLLNRLLGETNWPNAQRFGLIFLFFVLLGFGFSTAIHAFILFGWPMMFEHIVDGCDSFVALPTNSSVLENFVKSNFPENFRLNECFFCSDKMIFLFVMYISYSKCQHSYFQW